MNCAGLLNVVSRCEWLLLACLTVTAAKEGTHLIKKSGRWQYKINLTFHPKHSRADPQVFKNTKYVDIYVNI